LSACALALATGCKTRDVAVNNVREGSSLGVKVDGAGTEARLNQVGFLAPDFNRKIGVEATGAKRTATNTLEVWVSFRNRTSYEQAFQVRTQYFDADRAPNEGPNEWQIIHIPPNGIQTYKTYSSGTTAAYYYIEVMPL
jgi:hypothetical protein